MQDMLVPGSTANHWLLEYDGISVQCNPIIVSSVYIWSLLSIGPRTIGSLFPLVEACHVAVICLLIGLLFDSLFSCRQRK